VEAWATLPLDVIINVARHCGRRELQSCRLCNRHWCTGANFVVSSLHLTEELIAAFVTFDAAVDNLSGKFRNVKRLTVDGHVAVDFGRLCRAMPNVTALDLFGIQLRYETELLHVHEMANLKQLNLGGSNIRGNMLTPIMHCSGLETLDLWRTNLSYTDILCVLPFLENLTNLNLGYTRLQDKPMGFLPMLPRLQFLDLGNTAIGSQALQSLSGLMNLKSLFLDYTKVDDMGMQYLSPLTNLVDLNLGNTSISDAGLSHLTSLTNLMDLKLGHTTVSDVGLIHFSCLCNLMYVYLDGTNVRDGGVNYLTTIMPHLHVQIRLDTSGIQF